MKKTLPICLLALALGGFLGFFLGRAAVEGPRPSLTLQAAAISAPRQIFFISKAFPPKKAGTDLKFAAESCIVTTI